MPSNRPSSHRDCMLEALRLAHRPLELPYPNPWVGCVIVRDNKIVGRGWHRGPGTSHAEVAALHQAGRRAKGASLYVTLEPCCHYGKTPPCTDAILRAGIRRVYYALRDPSPLVAGRGARILKAHGVEVTAGLCAREAAESNEVYLKYRATGFPFVTVKIAATLDGKIATRTGQSKWITDERARRHARELRAEHQAVLVGIQTVLADDPHLGPRLRGRSDPWRVILDSRLRIPLASQAVRSGKCIVACAGGASERNKKLLKRRGVQVWDFKGRKVPLKKLLARLAESGMISVLVEGGSEVLGSFFDAGLADRVCWFLAPMIVGSVKSRAAVAGRGAATLRDACRLRDCSIQRAGDSWLLRGNISRWAIAASDG